MTNEVSSYSVDVQERLNAVGEDIFVYNDSGNLILSLQDQEQPQYLFALYDNYLILDKYLYHTPYETYRSLNELFVGTFVSQK